MMSGSYVAACHRLYRQGVLQQFGPGDWVGRGFADVGFEEYFVLHDGTLVSLITGQIVPLPVSERHAFFLIPTVDDIVAEIERLGGTVESVGPASREGGWCLMVTGESFEGREVVGGSLSEVFIRALGVAVGIDPFQESEGRLRVVCR